jgi:hypothetical protein
VLVECFIKLQTDRFKLLGYLGTRDNGTKGKGIDLFDLKKRYFR